MSYDYFYNRETEQYICYTLPKLFFENEELNKLSINAKFLYSILLDRAKSSYKNGFIDDENKVYVHYAQSKIMKLLHVERTQLYKYLNELDVKKGIGLIERTQKLGKGKTDRIYVKNFSKPITDDKLPIPTSDTKYTYFCDDVSAARFRHYPLPKVFFHDVDYAQKHTYSDDVLELQRLPSNAKMAYAYFLDRLQLSISKGKKDEYGRYYIICTEKDLQELLGCCIPTVRQTLSQLDTKDGVGLIERNADNPAIIYVLDYAVSLSRKADPKGEKSEHQKEKSEHQNKESEHHQKEKSEHQKKKSEHHHKESEHQKKKSEHPIYNDTDFNNTDFNDTNQSINQTPAAKQNQVTNEMIDRLIDEKSKDNSFIEALTAIGSKYADYEYNFGYRSEKDFELYDERDRRTKDCQIPYRLATDKKKMKEALKFLFAYSYRMGDMEKRDMEKEVNFLNSVIKALTELATQEKTKAGKRYIKYNEIIDKLNSIIRNSSLMDFCGYQGIGVICFREHWGRILADKTEKRIEIPNLYGFMKSCLANFLIDYDVCNAADEIGVDTMFREDFGYGYSSKKINESNTDKYSTEVCNPPETKTNTVFDTAEQSDDSETACQPDEIQCVMSVVGDEFEITDTSPPDNSSAAQDSEHQEQLSKEQFAELMARLKGETEEQKQAERERQEEIRQTKIRNAMFFKEMCEEEGNPPPNWVREILATNK